MYQAFFLRARDEEKASEPRIAQVALSLFTDSNKTAWYATSVRLGMGHFTVVSIVAKPLTWSEVEGDLFVIETSI